MNDRRSLIPLLLIVLVSGCATTDMMGGFNLISPQREATLGQELSQSIAKEEKVVADPEISGYIQQIGQRLVSVSLTPNEPRHFYVLDNNEINAFAIPGGHVYILTGLIQAAESEAEVAAVIAHELGHAEKRHPTQQLSRQMGTQILMSVILGKNPSDTQKVVTNLLATSGISAYSRSAEFEADQIGTYLLNRAGYDPYAMVSFFNKLVALEQQSGGGSGRSLFATHPPTQDRIQAVSQLANSFGTQKSTGKNLVGNFTTIQAKVKTMHSK